MADWQLIEEGLKRGYSLDEVTDIIAKEEGVDPSYARERGFDSPAILVRLGYVKPEKGFIGNVLDQAAHGVKTAYQGLLSAPGIYAGNPDAERIAGTIQAEQSHEKPKEMREAEAAFADVSKRQSDFESVYGKDSGYMDSIGKIMDMLVTTGKEIVTNPKGMAYEMASQSGNMVAPMVGAYAGGKTGAVTGALLGPKGAVAGGVVGAGAGGFAGSHVMEQSGEFRGKVAERLSELGLEPTAENVSAIFQDKAWLDKTLEETRDKATGTAVTDGVLAAIGGLAVNAPIRAAQKTARAQLGATATAKQVSDAAADILASQPKWQKVAPHLKAGAIGWGGEPISEAIGQQYGYGHVDYGDVGMEAFAAAGEGIGSVYAAAKGMRANPTPPATVTPSPSITSAPTADDAIKAFQDEVASVTPRGSFGSMDDLAGFIESERSDLGKRRGLLAQQQQDARDMVAEFSGLVKDEQIDQSYRLNDAQRQRDAERTREGGYDLALQQREEQQGRTVEQLAAASEAQGFGNEEPTAMQLAMQQAQQKALDNEFSGLLKQERASLNEMRANVKRVAGVPVEQISTPQLEEIAQSEALPAGTAAAMGEGNQATSVSPPATPVRTLSDGTPVVGGRSLLSVPSGQIEQHLANASTADERLAIAAEMQRRGLTVPMDALTSPIPEARQAHVQPHAQQDNGRDYTHLDALSLRLSNERMRLGQSKTDQERTARQVIVDGIEREIASERKFLGLPDNAIDEAVSEDDLLRELQGDNATAGDGARPNANQTELDDGIAASLQNRNRDSAASISQMNKIANNPNPRLLMAAPTMGDGAPVVTDLHGALQALIDSGRAVLGERDSVVTGKRDVPVQYAVVEATDLSPSNFANGGRNQGYVSDRGKVVAINNGRTAGIMEAYSRGTTKGYRAAIEGGQRVHGIPAEAITGMRSPVLVRIMDRADVTRDIGDESNTSSTLGLSATEQARNDAARFDVSGVEYLDDGSPTSEALRGFVASMPASEQQSLAPDGVPTIQAKDRMMAAMFHSAYENDGLVNLVAQATDPEAKNVLNGLSRAAAAMAKLKNAGDLDIRGIVTGAVQKLVNATRSGLSMAEFLRQNDMLDGSAEHEVALVLAANARSGKRIGEILTEAAEFAYTESQKEGVDMFGDPIPRATRDDVIRRITDGNDTGRQENLGQQGGRLADEGNAGTKTAGRGGQGDAGRAQANQPGAGYDTDFALESYTQQDIKEREARIKAAEKEAAKLQAELEKKEKADRERDLFQLTGSDLPADNPNQGSLFQRARRYDTQTIDMFASLLPAATGSRPHADTAASTESARLGATAGALLRGTRGSLLGLAFAADWIVGRGSTLVGKTVTSPADLATLAATLRDPRIETFRYFLVKDNKVVYHTAVSSRLYDSTDFAIGDQGKFLDGIKATMTRLGADGYYIMHNHPSRTMKASAGDINVTRQLASDLPGFLGHVVLDHNEFVLIGHNGDTSVEKLSGQEEDQTRATNRPHPVLGTIINGPAAFVDIADKVRSKNNVVLVSTDAQLGIVGVMEAHPDQFRKAGFDVLRTIGRLRKASGSNIVFAVLPDSMGLAEIAPALLTKGWFIDAYGKMPGGGTGSASSTRINGAVTGQIRRNKKRKGIAVEQPSATYGQGDLFADMSEAERMEIAKASQKNSPQMSMFDMLDGGQELMDRTLQSVPADDAKAASADEQDKGAKFSRAINSSKRAASKRASLPPVSQSVIDGLIAGLPGVRQAAGDARITTLFSPSELPSEVLDQAREEGIPENEIHGVLFNGRAYIVRQNLKTRQDVEEVLLHEIMGHGGVRALLGGSRVGVLLESFNRAGGVAGLRQIAKTYGVLNALNQRIPKGPLNNAQKSALVDELLALAQGKNQKLRQVALEWLGKARNFIIAALDKAGLHETAARLDKFDATETAKMLREMRDAVIAGGDIGGHGVAFMTAWHGSPHDHDGFDSSKIGTGEGAQAYGYGLYFSGAREVAEGYRIALTSNAAKKQFDVAAALAAAKWFKSGMVVDGTTYYSRMDLQDDIAKQNLSSMHMPDDVRQVFADKLSERNGRLYKVELAPEPDEYLDWDKPLSEQSEKVREALIRAGVIVDGKYGDGFGATPMFPGWSTFTGESIHRRIVNREFEKQREVTAAARKRAEQAASEYLQSIGIRGIRYLDGSSRSAGNGTSNYVIFDSADVKITAKESRRASNDLDFTQPQGSEPLRKTSFGYANDTHNLFHVSTFKGNDGDVSTFDVYDTNTGIKLGEVSLGLRGDEITTLANIESKDKKTGFGEQLLRSLVANNPDGIYIINMLPEAVPFWQKMGVSLDEHFEGVWEHGNGVLTEEAIQTARNSERGIAAEDSGGERKESRGSEESGRGRQADNPVSSKGVADKTAPANAGVSVSALSESVRRIQAVVERFKSQFKGASALDIRVVSTTFDIPARFRPSPFAEGVFHDDAGLVYLVTMNLRNPRGELSENRAWQVLLHESVGHHGLSQMMGDKFASILKAVKQATHTNGRVNQDSRDTFKPGDKDYATWDAVSLRYRGASDSEIAQEVLARMSETDSGSSVLGYAVAVVRQWVREMARAMGANLVVSTSELRDLVAKASGYMRRGDNLAEERVPSGLVAASTGVAREGGKRGLESRAATVQPQGPIWSAPEMSRTDNIIYTMQDKNIDLKRVQQAIKSTAGEIRDDIDAYLQEELFHGRAAKITEEFLDKEVNPLISLMRASNVSMEEMETFLWARHAKERNAQIAKINDEMPDGGSGLTNKQADDLMGGKDVTIGDKTIEGVKPNRKELLSNLAGRVDAITRGNRALLEHYSLESADTLNAWDGAYKHYVPLHREDADSHLAGMGTGMGYSVKGASSKRATGSSRPVENILANLALQRERIITRGEKNRVAQSLYGLAKEMPNADLWEVDVKPTIRTTAMVEGREQVVDAVDPNFRNRPNVVFARFNGEDRFVVFNEHNERAVRMAEALKNLDADDISHLLGEVSRWTRYFASINTQYNPIFGVTNLVRDVQTGLLNLKSTPIAGKQKEMMGHLVQALPAVFKALRAGRKGQAATGTWAQLLEEFQEVGGQTGYRDMFRNSQERAEALQNALDPTWWQKTWWGKAATVGGVLAVPEQAFLDKVGKPLMELLSDYNTMMENGIRLAAYKVALDTGMTQARAASLAKNLTVNFNRKGQAARQVGAMYAFFNASVQGTARMAETLNHGAKPGELLGKAGKQIVYGGLLLGAVQAMLLMAAGFDDEEPPEFVRDRNIIIPTGNGKYVSIPMPLGFHVLPAISRISIEFTAGGFKKPGEHLVHIMDVLLDSFNPIGNAGLSMQTVAPTVLDPIAALTENKDWSGRQIARQDFSKLNPTPGYTRAKDTASSLSRGLAYAFNYLSGGGEYGIGIVSPTPDQIDYLLGQLTGGVGRELGKVLTTGEAMATGEDLPPHKIPLVGRFYGDTTGQSSEASKFYGTLEKLSEHRGTLDRMKDAHDLEAYREYAKEHPESRLYARAARVQRELASLRKLKRKMIERNADRAKVRQIEDRMRTLMTRFNQSVSEQKGDH